MDKPLVIKVVGQPKPQGSMKAFVVRSKTGALHAAVTHGKSRELDHWRNFIALNAAAAMRQGRLQVLDEALAVEMRFVVPKPKSARKRDLLPTKRPDLDKFLRAALDAMTGVVFRDDSCVVEIHATKHYDATAGEAVGVVIVVRNPDGASPR